MGSLHVADDFKTINQRMKDLEREATHGLTRKGPTVVPLPSSPYPARVADDFKTISQRMKGLEQERAKALSHPISAPRSSR